MAAADKAVLLVYMPKKLKHIALEKIRYQLANTCLIISTIGWRFCDCWKYNGCRARPTHINLFGEQNYYIICQIRKTLNLDRICNITKIQDILNTFFTLKKELQIFLNSGHRIFWLYHYSQQFKLGSKKKQKSIYLKNYIQQNYYNICYLDP